MLARPDKMDFSHAVVDASHVHAKRSRSLKDPRRGHEAEGSFQNAAVGSLRARIMQWARCRKPSWISSRVSQRFRSSARSVEPDDGGLATHRQPAESGTMRGATASDPGRDAFPQGVAVGVRATGAARADPHWRLAVGRGLSRGPRQLDPLLGRHTPGPA